jgi:60 kDa SS-A/Ro ribonucleoprotein
MMTKLRELFSTRKTPQNRPITGSGQVPNSAGGYAWPVDDWVQLDRFLVLGSENGTYYIRPQKLTIDNANAIILCLDEDGVRVVNRVVEVSQDGRAPKNDPALFVLAMAAGLGDEATRKAAIESLPKVARIGTHLFHFLDYVEGFRGWGRALRRGIGEWYTGMDAERLAYQAVKYQQRDGWSHRDALRLAHPKAPTELHDQLFNWITQGWEAEQMTEMPPDMPALKTIWAFEQA